MDRSGRHAEFEGALEVALVGETGKAGKICQRITALQQLAGVVDPAIELIGVWRKSEFVPEPADEPE